MSGLLGSLSAAARSLDAQRFGLDVTGQNIANVNTAGYTRRTLDLSAIPPVDSRSAGNGVEAVRVRALRADLIEAQLRHEQPAQSREAAVAGSLSQIETALGMPGHSLDASLTQFYQAFAQLAQDPISGVARQQVAVQGQSLATAFNNVAARLTSAGGDADAGIRSAVDGINALAFQIAALNESLGGAGSGSAETLRDQQALALKALSELIDISVVSRADGGVDVSMGNGRALVIGADTYGLEVRQAPGTGLAGLWSGGVDITDEITGGTVGGLLHVRDVLLPGYISRLDDLAYGVATSVNTIHGAGYDLDGNTNIDFFTPPGAVAGAASGLSLAAGIRTNPRSIAAAGGLTFVAGDNQNARAIANLAQTVIAGSTTNPVDTWGALVYRVGIDAQVANNERTSREEILQQLETLRDQISGVSLDEEAANLMKFQRAYEANARYFSAIDRALDTLMLMVGV
jgi:flagellar hook-associated protein 1 FlgK